ncbi:MAG: tetratricopeptide repeat protein [Candidatus Peregrinibacteria bacterium]|nr:tetratricopeptide repeat protein [Candidatus Peregrinibacteria bacterium]MCB9807952.1 tetratricopeptide repeat protein [Candidatus Peribacteria bacterium]
MRIALRNRGIRKFVRGIKQRTEKARERGLSLRETHINKTQITPRASAVQLQKIRTVLREAEKACARRNYSDAEKLLIQALTTSPGSTDVQAQLAKLYLLMDKDVKAEALYRDILLEDQHVSFYANLGLACYKQGKFLESCEAYQDAYQLDPKNPERAAAFARACMAALRFDAAVPLLEFACERLPRDVSLLQMLGQSYEHLGLLKEAESAYMRIHRLQPYDEAVKQKLSELTF